MKAMVKKGKTNGKEAEAYFMSILKKYTKKASVSELTAKRPTAAPPSSLKSILEHAKNAKND
jgi:polyhydroxyalkanoate synthesis regulator phasin